MAQELPDMQKLAAFLRATPANLFFKDTECKYRFSTEQCDMVNSGAEPSILGKTDLEVQVYKEFGRIYYEDDLKILATGTPSQYVSEIPTPDGMRYYEIRKNPVYVDGKILGIVGMVDDITPRMRMEKELEQLSYRDSLTGLYNRRYLDVKGQQFVNKAAGPLTVIMADCNYLKHTNDTYGHEYGDLLLKRAARIIRDALPTSSIVLRIGGDEFLLLCPGCSAAQAQALLADIRARFARESDDRIPLSVAFGCCTQEQAPFSLREAYHSADRAMYLDKHRIKK